MASPNNEGGSYAYDEPLLSRSPRYSSGGGSSGAGNRSTRIARNVEQNQHAPPQHAFLLSPATNSSSPTDDNDDRRQGRDGIGIGENIDNNNNIVNESIDVFHVMCELLYGHHNTTTQQQEQPHRLSRQQQRASSLSSSSPCLIRTTQATLFWGMMMMFTLVLGLLMGILSVGFVATHTIVMDYWFHYDSFDNTTINFDDNWIWIVITTVGGGFLCGVLLLVIDEGLSTTNHAGGGGLGLLLHRTSSTIKEASILKIVCHDFLLVLCSLVALSAGIPLGDEVALCIMANTIASILTKIVIRILQPNGNDYNVADHYHCRDERIYSILSCASTSSALNIFVPSPLLSILVLHEILSSSSSFSMVQSTLSSTQNSRYQLQNNNIINNQSLASYNIHESRERNEDDIVDNHDRDDTIFRHEESSTTISSRTSSDSSYNELFWNNPYMEQITVATIATLMASIVTSALIPDQFGGGDSSDDVDAFDINHTNYSRLFSSILINISSNRRRILSYSSATYFDGDSSDDHGVNEFTMLRHWGAAIALGLLCGGIVSCMLVIGSVGKAIRIQTIKAFNSYCCCVSHKKYLSWIPKLLFPTLAGAIVGILAIYVSPLTIGNDFTIFLDSEGDNNDNNDDRVMPVGAIDWTSLAIAKCLAVSVCLGLGGSLGGPVLPMVLIGKCIGLALSSSAAASAQAAALVSSNLAIPCCVCACVGAILPSPIAIALIVAMEDDGPHLNLNQLSSLFLAAVVGYGVTGGFGILRPCVVGCCCSGDDNEEGQEDELAYSMVPVHSSSSTPNNGVSMDYQRSEDGSSVTIEQTPSDYDFLNTIRSAIFGTQE